MATAAKTKTASKKAAQAVLPVRVLGVQGKESTTPLPKAWQESVAAALLAQAVHVGQKRQRIRRAHTKERADVRGGGAKPWRQKGTGRARHGSRRSPLWVGGGTTFGPRSRSPRVLGLPKHMQRKALAGALADKAQAGLLTVIQLPEKVAEKTREAKELLGTDARAGLLVVVHDDQRDWRRSLRNLPGVQVQVASLVAVTELVRARGVWVSEEALKVLEERSS